MALEPYAFYLIEADSTVLSVNAARQSTIQRVQSTCGNHKTPIVDPQRKSLLKRGIGLEYATLGWNVVGVVVVVYAALQARSVALAGFGLDSLIEIGASTVVLWELTGTGQTRQKTALRLIGGAFLLLALYILVQSARTLYLHQHPSVSPLGMIWLSVK